MLTENPSFVKSNQLGVASFPTVPGGKGNPADLEGNTTGYVGLAAHISPAATYVSEQFADYAFTTQSFAKAEVAAGNIPVIAGSAGLLNASPLKNYLVPIYQSVVHAPYFQYSWDQALGAHKGSANAGQPGQGLRAIGDAEAVRINNERLSDLRRSWLFRERLETE